MAALATVVPLIVRLPPSRLRALLERIGSPGGRTESPEPTLEARIDRGIALASRFVKPSCLVRGITRYVFLRLAGHDAQLAFGMGGNATGFAGHCWIELGGVPYRERRDPRSEFPEMFRIPTRAGS